MTAILSDQPFATGPGFGLQRADIAISAGRIVRIAPAGTLDGPRIEGLSATLALPGLINAHTHGHANFARGLADRWTLEMSLVSGPWVSGPRDRETIYLSTLLGAIDMLSRGITACYDLVLESPGASLEGMSAVAEAYRDAGLRAILCPMVADRTLFQAVPGLEAHVRAARPDLAPGPAPASEEVLNALEAILSGVDWVEGVIEPALAPTIATHCSPALMTGARDLARSYGARLHMHVAEARFQARAARDMFGRPLVMELDRLGLLSERFTAAHAVWLEPDEQALLADRGAQMVHLPLSNARLGVGTAPIAVARDRGLAVGLATDGANSADALDLLAVARQATLSSRGFGAGPERWLSAPEALDLATRGSAACMGWTGRAGAIAEGHVADLCFLSFPPLPGPARHDALVEALNGRVEVAATMVAGDIVMRDGRHRRFDSAALAARVAPAFARWFAAGAPARAVAEGLTPHVVDYVQAYGAGHAGGARFIPETAA